MLQVKTNFHNFDPVTLAYDLLAPAKTQGHSMWPSLVAVV